MITCEEFYNLLIRNGIDFFCGVPDSSLKDFLAYVFQHAGKQKNIITANEGNAIALSAGYYLATGKIGLVYMQNSGQGNSINPLVSLVDREVYSIPVLLLIGWRGEPEKKDEPQHIKQGKVTQSLLRLLEIKFNILPNNIEGAKKIVGEGLEYMKKQSAPYAIIVRTGTFQPFGLDAKPVVRYEMTREAALKIIVDQLSSEDVVVSTTGKTSRELFEYREECNQGHETDFLTVGSMGHSSQIALGIALSRPSRNVYCIDGDGATIMHMGSLAIIGTQGPRNFKHIIINNGAHDSVGGQPTVGFEIDFVSIAKACRYKTVLKAETAKELEETLRLLKTREGPCFLEVRVCKGARGDLGRPTIPPIENKRAFMNFLNAHR